MALKQNALTYLPEIIVVNPSGSNYSLKSLKGAIYKVAQMQKDEVGAGTYNDLVVNSSNPFTKSIWDIVVTTPGTDTYTLSFDSEDIVKVDGVYAPTALSSRRQVDVEIKNESESFTVRSLLAALRFVEGLEDKKDVNGVATGTVTADTAIVADTVTVNGVVYTAVSGTKSDNTEFSIDTGDNETAADLADSINNDTREGAGVVSASASGAVVTLTSNTKGEDANGITLASSDSTLAVSGATLSGAGGDGTYTQVTLNGFTPFETFEWTIEKAGNVYTLTPLAGS